MEHEEGILDTVLQVHKVVKGRSATSEPTLGIREVSALQDPYKSVVYHMLHGFINTTGQTDQSVTSYKGAILIGF